MRVKPLLPIRNHHHYYHCHQNEINWTIASAYAKSGFCALVPFTVVLLASSLRAFDLRACGYKNQHKIRSQHNCPHLQKSMKQGTLHHD
jgi:hypothetical protein